MPRTNNKSAGSMVAYIAEVSTRNFTFVALAETAAAARAALMAGWREHCRRYPGADPKHVLSSDVCVQRMVYGQCLRDGEPIAPSTHEES